MNRTLLAGGEVLIVGLALALASGTANAGIKAFKCSASGSVVDLPIDPDSDSCFTAANGATVCTDYSGHADLSGNCSPGGGVTTQNVVEIDPVAGSGCNIRGSVVPWIARCTLAESSEQGCAFQAVGGAEVDRDKLQGRAPFFYPVADLLLGPVQWASIQLHWDL